MHGDPVVHFLPFWELDGLAEVDARVEARLRCFVEAVPESSGLEAFFGAECLWILILEFSFLKI